MMFIAELFSETPFMICSRLTISETIACRAGTIIATSTPWKTAVTIRCQYSSRPSSASVPMASVLARPTSWKTCVIVRLGKRSASTPP